MRLIYTHHGDLMLTTLVTGRCTYSETASNTTKTGQPLYRGLFSVLLSTYIDPTSQERIFNKCTVSAIRKFEFIKGEIYCLTGRVSRIIPSKKDSKEQFIYIDFPIVKHVKGSSVQHENDGDEDGPLETTEEQDDVVPW